MVTQPITLDDVQRRIAGLEDTELGGSIAAWILRGQRDRIMGIHLVDQDVGLGTPEHNAYLAGWGEIHREISEGKRPVRFLCDILAVDPDARGQKVKDVLGEICRLDQIDFPHSGCLVIREVKLAEFNTEYHIWALERFKGITSEIPELVVWTEKKLVIPKIAMNVLEAKLRFFEAMTELEPDQIDHDGEAFFREGGKTIHYIYTDGELKNAVEMRLDHGLAKCPNYVKERLDISQLYRELTQNPGPLFTKSPNAVDVAQIGLADGSKIRLTSIQIPEEA